MYSFNSKKELIDFLADNIINTNEATEILGCSRQNVDDLVKRKKLIPVKIFLRDRLFFKKDVLDRIK